MQQGGAPTFPQHVSMEHSGMTGLDQGNIQSMLAQAGLMGAGQAAAAANATPGIAQVLPPSSTPNLPPSTSLMLSAQGTPAVLGSGVQSALGNFTASRADSASMPAISASPPTSFGRSSPPMHTGSYDGSGRSSPAFPGLASANPTLSTRQGPNSGTGSPLGTFGAIGSSHIGAAAEEALVAHLGHALQPSALGERGHGSQ